MFLSFCNMFCLNLFLDQGEMRIQPILLESFIKIGTHRVGLIANSERMTVRMKNDERLLRLIPAAKKSLSRKPSNFFEKKVEKFNFNGEFWRFERRF